MLSSPLHPLRNFGRPVLSGKTIGASRARDKPQPLLMRNPEFTEVDPGIIVRVDCADEVMKSGLAPAWGTGRKSWYGRRR